MQKWPPKLLINFIRVGVHSGTPGASRMIKFANENSSTYIQIFFYYDIRRDVPRSLAIRNVYTLAAADIN
jgi:hypothetical protein